MRTDSKGNPLPEGMLEIKDHYYWRRRNKTQPLGTDYALAIRRHKVIERLGDTPQTCDQLFDEYEALVLESAPDKKTGLVGQNTLRIKPKTAQGYLNILRNGGPLRGSFGPVPPRDIKTSHIVRFLDKRKPKPAAVAEIRLLSVMMTYAAERGWVDSNPCLGVRKYKRGERPRRNRYITDSEYSTVYAAASPSIQIFMSIAYLTGLRLGDVLRLKVADISDEYLHAVESKTGNKVRFVLSDALREAIEREKGLPGRARSDRCIIRGRYGRCFTVDGFESSWQRLRKKHNVKDFRANDLRAKHATDRDERGLQAQIALGHVDAQTTVTYIRHPLGRVQEPLE